MLRRARLWDCKSSVRPSDCLSVCPSVTLRYVFHTGWNTSKIISRLISIRYLLTLSSTWAVWCNGNTPKIRVELGMESGAHKSCKICETVQDRTKVTITDERRIGCHLRAFNWHQSQWSWMTLKGRSVTLAEINKISGAHYKNFNDDRLILLAAKCRPMIVVSKNIRCVRIFIVSSQKYRNSAS